MPVTMKDIAEAAQISRPTVSLILNGRADDLRISEHTRNRVLDIAGRLGYRRNELAKSVKTGKTNIIGFIGGLTEEYEMRVIKGINDGLSDHNYLLKMFGVKNEPEHIARLARQCVEQMVAGVICRALNKNDLTILLKELTPHNIPVVLVDNSFSTPCCGRIISDDAAGTAAAVKYLFELGHRHIAHLSHVQESGFVSLRRQGFVKGMKSCGLSCSEDNFFTIDNIREVTPAMPAEFDRMWRDFHPTAVVCVSDPVALKLLQWGYMRQLRVPDDFSLIGFADLGLALYSSPALTTIAQPFWEMGKHAAARVLAMLNGAPPEDETVPVKLVERNSVASPKQH